MRNRNVRVIFIWGMFCANFTGAFCPVIAQTGPSTARIVPSFRRALPPRPVSAERIALELAVSPAGEVIDVVVTESSGDLKVDERTRQFYLGFRVIPAIDEHGALIAGKISVDHRYASRARGARPRQIKESATSWAAAEAERISRMTCSDFVWEYDLIRKVAGRDSFIAFDRLPRVSLAAFFSANHLTDKETKILNRALGDLTTESASQCRGRPDFMYWRDVFEPRARARIKKNPKPSPGAPLENSVVARH